MWFERMRNCCSCLGRNQVGHDLFVAGSLQAMRMIDEQNVERFVAYHAQIGRSEDQECGIKCCIMRRGEKEERKRKSARSTTIYYPGAIHEWSLEN